MFKHNQAKSLTSGLLFIYLLQTGSKPFLFSIKWSISSNQSSEFHFQLKSRKNPEEKCVFLHKYDSQSESGIQHRKAELIFYFLEPIRIDFELFKYVLTVIFIFPQKIRKFG